MNEIKLHKQLTQIETFDGILFTPATPAELDRMLDERKFIQIGDERIAVHQIKRYYPQQIGEIESHILSKPKDIQIILRAREKEKKSNVGRGFDSIGEIERYLESKTEVKNL